MINEVVGDNPWGIEFLQGLFNMTSDSHLFSTYDDLKEKGLKLNGNYFIQERGREMHLPLYEAKMFMSYDHRFADVVVTDNLIRPGQQDNISYEEHLNPEIVVRPRYWVSQQDVREAILKYSNEKWLFGYKNVTSPTNERTFIGTILPITAAGHSIQFILSKERTLRKCCLVSNLNSLIFDFIAKQKIGGINFSYFILKQLPTIPPTGYRSTLLSLIITKVLELTYTAWDIKAFADDLWREADEPLRAALKQQWDENVAGTDGGHVDAEPPSWAEIAPDGFPYPPFKWDEERRARLRAELDAIYAHLYGLTKEELDYILETFPIVRRKDIEKYGSYRTKEMILQCYGKYAAMFNKPSEEAAR